jgi:RNA polymerase sigma-70 factor (ECF subfamily)
MDASPADLTDAELLARHGSGDPGAFAALYRRHIRPLWLYARSLTGDPALSEDLVQEAFVRVLRMPPSEIRDSVQGLLYSAVRNLARDEARRTAVRERVHPSLAPRPGSGPDRELAEAVSRAIDRLPETQREVVVLKVWAGLTFAEIAAVSETPAPTVMSRYRYAIEKLAELLGDA